MSQSPGMPSNARRPCGSSWIGDPMVRPRTVWVTSTWPSPNRFGIPAFYDLHAWASEANPSGPFNDWNPKVLCLNTEGHQP